VRKSSIVIILIFLAISYAVYGQEKPGSIGEINFNSAMMLSVSIGGQFVSNGTFPAVPGERVDQFITRIYNQVITLTPYMRYSVYGLRNITLRRFSGEIIQVDLQKFRLTGDYQFNPLLQNDDVIIFPPYDDKTNFISIGGAVVNPKTFQYVEGDRLSDAILFSGGINPAYENIVTASISRLDYEGKNERIEIYQISENPVLQRGDRIRLLGEEPQRKNFHIRVGGEVNRPGRIPITRGTTTLREVIKNAGGFKASADLNNAELIRGRDVVTTTRATEQFDILMMQRMANISAEDSLSFLADNKLRFFRANGVLNFNNLDDTNSIASKFIVQNEDSVFIPSRLNLVYVYGQVNNPGYIEFVSGSDYKYYIQKAGGIAQTAKDEIYIIKGKSRAWIQVEEDNVPQVDAGDYIWIPKERPREFSYYRERVTAVAGVVSAVATILLLIVQLSK